MGTSYGTAACRRAVRRGWDSNPRYPCEYNSLAGSPIRPLSHLSRWCMSRRCIARSGGCGEGGIRTPGAPWLNGFQDRLLRPLGHLSEAQHATRVPEYMLPHRACQFAPTDTGTRRRTRDRRLRPRPSRPAPSDGPAGAVFIKCPTRKFAPAVRAGRVASGAKCDTPTLYARPCTAPPTGCSVARRLLYYYRIYGGWGGFSRRPAVREFESRRPGSDTRGHGGFD